MCICTPTTHLHLFDQLMLVGGGQRRHLLLAHNIAEDCQQTKRAKVFVRATGNAG